MRRVIYSTLARMDITEACRWYDTQAAGISKRFLKQLRSVERRMSGAPHHFPFARQAVRRASVPDFPFVLYFYADEQTVNVIACVHTSREPTVWQRRL